VLRAPDLREKLAVEAIEPITVMSPEEFCGLIKTDIALDQAGAKERDRAGQLSFSQGCPWHAAIA
jgi:hypothetical protein